MQLTDILANTGGLQSMARELGVSESEAHSGAAALLPAILGGFQKHAESAPNGVHGLGDTLAKLGGGALLDNVVSAQPTDIGRGNNVLGEIFGSKDVSRSVAEGAASQTSLHPSLLKRMLPMVAMMAAGYMAKQGQSGGQLGGLAGMLGGRSAANPLDAILGGRR